MLLDQKQYVVKATKKGFAGKQYFEFLDPQSGNVVGTAEDKTGFVAGLLGAATFEVRDASNNTPLFTVGRKGLLFKKDQVLSPQGEVVGTYKGKRLSLSGGYHMYDKAGKHLGEIKGKMFKAEYKFLTPDKKSEMGTVSRTWAGLARSLLTGDGSYAVTITPQFADNKTMKMLILGATIAAETFFKNKKGAAAIAGGDDEEDEGEED